MSTIDTFSIAQQIMDEVEDHIIVEENLYGPDWTWNSQDVVNTIKLILDKELEQ